MANGGYTGALPARDDSPEAYSGVWESQEQYAELAAGRWAQQATGLAPRSVRLNPSDTPYFSKTFGASGNRRTWTMSWWQKRYSSNYGGSYGTYQNVWGLTTTNDDAPSGGASSTGYTYIEFRDDKLFVGEYYGNNVWAYLLQTTAVYRDFSAWYNYQITLDTNNPIASERVRIYINGQRYKDAWVNEQYPTLSRKGIINIGSVQNLIGAFSTNGQGINYGWLNSSLADFKFIDGQALEPEAFGFFDGAGVWQPRPYRGTYGTNGFYLDFSDNSAATATALGADRSGNGNNWSPNNIAAFPSTDAFTANTTLSTDKPVQIANMFDGNDSTMQELGGFTQNVYYSATINRTLTGTGSLIIYTSYGVSSGNINVFEYNITHNGGVTTGWTAYSVPMGSPQSLNIGTYTNITQINIRCRSTTSSGNGGQYVYGFTFNGAPLIDNAYASGNDSLLDSPVNGRQSDTGLGGQVQGNYATLNPLHSQGATFTNGNLQFSTSSIGKIFATIAVNSGKWYWESQNLSSNSLSSLVNGVGLITGNPNTYGGGGAGDYAWLTRSNSGSPSSAYNNGSVTGYGNIAVAQYAIVGTAFDADAGTLEFFVNGVSQGVAWNNIPVGADKFYAPISGDPNSSTDTEGYVNFGQQPFRFQAPSGYKALCTANLPEPAIKRGDDYFQTLLYTGNGSTLGRSVNGARFAPDLAWIKDRSAGNWHQLRSTLQNGIMHSNDTSGEQASNANGIIGSLDANGFTLSTSTNTPVLNTSGNNYVAWLWDAGTSTVTLNPGDPGAGSIASQVRVNPSAGFSIIDFSATNGTVGHGLGVAPEFFIYKARTTASNWSVYHKSLGNTKRLLLNTTDAEGTSSIFWNNTSPTSSVITLGSNFSGVGSSIIYAFAPIAGFSSFGSYTGNFSTDGPFVYTGFRPRWIMFKCSSTNNGYTFWEIIDTARPNNLAADLSDAEGSYNLGTGLGVDILSNGFKIRGAGSGKNLSGQTYVYAAFAEHPFRSARAR